MPSVGKEIKPSESHWIERPQKPRWVASTLVLVLGAQIPGIVQRVAKPLAGEMASMILEVVMYIVLLLIVLLWATSGRRARRMRSQDDTLVEGAFGDQFPAEVTIAVADQRLGMDRGVLWFADGLMGFIGAAASFVLAASDVSVPIHATSQPKPKRGQERFHPIIVVLEGASQAGQIAIGPLAGHEAAFRDRFAVFTATDERPEGERFWPPLVPYRAFEEQVSALD